MNNKPVRLTKKEPLTITLTPLTTMLGILTVMLIVTIGFESIENVNYLMAGV